MPNNFVQDFNINSLVKGEEICNGRFVLTKNEFNKRLTDLTKIIKYVVSFSSVTESNPNIATLSTQEELILAQILKEQDPNWKVNQPMAASMPEKGQEVAQLPIIEESEFSQDRLKLIMKQQLWLP